ncbi:MAG TPA: diacylglycerol kinase family protein [Baekduia sp.]|nr:diacylglycerol kinase family protein [Baekduia sp.]
MASLFAGRPIPEVSSRALADKRRLRMLVVVNPYATTVSERLRGLVVHALGSRFDVVVTDTEARGHATQIVSELASDHDLVVAFGGDGTVNEIANGLAGTDVPMTALPGGSTSVFARLLGYPNDVVDATEQLLQVADRFEPRRVDLGKVDDRYFTFTSGYGFDASVVAQIDAHPRMKAQVGHWYGAYAGLKIAATQYAAGPPKIQTTVDGTRVADGVTVMIQNAETYTYFRDKPLRVAVDAGLQTGSLAGTVLTSSRPTVVPGIARRVLSRKAEVIDHASVSAFSDAHEIIVEADREVPLHVDGDHIGSVRRARYSIAPGALLVVS